MNGLLDKTHRILSITFNPIRGRAREPIPVMWSSYGHIPSRNTWTPDHFVPLLPASIERSSVVTISPITEGPSPSNELGRPQVGREIQRTDQCKLPVRVKPAVKREANPKVQPLNKRKITPVQHKDEQQVQRQNKRGQQVIATTPQHEREIDCKVFSPIVPASDLPSITNKSTTYKYDENIHETSFSLVRSKRRKISNKTSNIKPKAAPSSHTSEESDFSHNSFSPLLSISTMESSPQPNHSPIAQVKPKKVKTAASKAKRKLHFRNVLADNPEQAQLVAPHLVDTLHSQSHSSGYSMDVSPPFPDIHVSPPQCMSSPVMHNNHRRKFTLEVPNCVSMGESDYVSLSIKSMDGVQNDSECEQNEAVSPQSSGFLNGRFLDAKDIYQKICSSDKQLLNIPCGTKNNKYFITCQCLATFTPLKWKILIFFRDVISLLALVVILLIDTATQEVPMTNI